MNTCCGRAFPGPRSKTSMCFPSTRPAAPTGPLGSGSTMMAAPARSNSSSLAAAASWTSPKPMYSGPSPAIRWRSSLRALTWPRPRRCAATSSARRTSASRRRFRQPTRPTCWRSTRTGWRPWSSPSSSRLRPRPRQQLPPSRLCRRRSPQSARVTQRRWSPQRERAFRGYGWVCPGSCSWAAAHWCCATAGGRPPMEGLR